MEDLEPSALVTELSDLKEQVGELTELVTNLTKVSHAILEALTGPQSLEASHQRFVALTTGRRP